MGYYTRYSGNIVPTGQPDSEIEQAEKQVAHAIAQLPEFNYYWSRWINDVKTIHEVVSYEEIKWYDCIKDMINISQQFPNFTICIHGEGEDREDIWDAYFKNGKYVRYYAEIAYPTFNPDDLREPPSKTTTTMTTSAQAAGHPH